MHKRLNRTQRNYIIMGLCAVLLIMAVGYAAFQSQLKITGTSNIASNFLVKITGIESIVQSGSASNAIEPSYTDTTATFKTNLVSPGDSMKYDITVANEGNIDAVLNSIKVSNSNNEAITFETSGIEEGDELKASETDILTVLVTYNPSITSQPENTIATITVTLDYGQSGGSGNLPSGNDQTIGGQEVEIVSSGDGLYEDSYENGRLIYRGQNPNNYIEFNDELWRIIAKETDGTYKIIRNDVLANRPFDNANHRLTENNSYCVHPQYGCGVYAAVEGEFSSPSGSQKGTVTEDSSIKIYLNEDYYVNNINGEAKEQMTTHAFNIGAVDRLDQSGAENDSIEKNIEGEKMYTWTGYVGLVNVSDILRASTNHLCTSVSISYNGTNECNSNYLLDRGTTSELFYWTINPDSRESGGRANRVWRGIVNNSVAAVYTDSANYNTDAPRPVVFLKSSIVLSGNGTQSSPFKIV